MKKTIAVFLFVLAWTDMAHAAKSNLRTCASYTECRDAFDAGDTDVKSAFKYRINSGWDRRGNYDALEFLIIKGGVSERTDLDLFYSDYLYDMCHGKLDSRYDDRNHFFKDLNDSKSTINNKLRYRPDAGLRFYLDVMAYSKATNDVVILCTLGAVADYGWDKSSLLEYGLERARNYDNQNLIQAIVALQAEIEKQKNNL